MTVTSVNLPVFSNVCMELFPPLYSAVVDGRPTEQLKSMALLARINSLCIRLSSLEMSIGTIGTIGTLGTIGVDDMVVRPASEEDSIAAASLFEACFTELGKRYRAVRLFVKTAVKDILQNSGTNGIPWLGFVVLVKGKVVGYGAIRVVNGIGEVRHMCVNAMYRRKGIGSILLDRMLLYGMSIRAVSYALTCMSDAVDARALYVRYGFREVRTEEFAEGYALTHMARRTDGC